MSQALYTENRQGQIRRVIPDLIRSRALLRDLVSKDLRARYRNAAIGFLWAILQPVLMMLILTFVFGFLLKSFMPERATGKSHTFAVYLLCGLVPWQFLTLSLSTAVSSLVINHDLIKKVYFPRETIPLAAILNNVVSLGIGFVTLLVVMAVLEGVGSIGIGLLWTPVVFAVQFVLILGLALLFSALNVRFRDFSYLVEVGLAFGFYATPIFYELPKGIDPWLQRVYMLNPMAHLVMAYRQAILDNQFPDLVHLAWPGIVAAMFLVLGVVVFRRYTPTFADYL